MRASFKNCIFFGSSRDEILIDDIANGTVPNLFDLTFENCIVKVDELLTQEEGLYADFLENQCNTCLNAARNDKLFMDPNEDDYHLDSLSIAIGQAQPITGIDIDLEANLRDSQPDVGCFERQN